MSSHAIQLAELIRAAGSVVALTGAGVSVPSGIPDFRTPGSGLWTNVDPMEVAHIDVFRRDPARFWHFYGDRFQTLEHKLPNAAHAALARLEQAGLLDAVITQNIDRLHARAGTRELVEVHGTIDHSSCLACGARYPLADVRHRQRVDAAGVPRCDCGEPLKPDVVLFGEYLPAEALARAEQLAAGGDVAIITQGATPFDGRAAVRCGGDVVRELEAVLAALGPELVWVGPSDSGVGQGSRA